MKSIKVVITMDVEPTTATTHPTATGPANWELGERAVRGYAKIAASYGFPVTFFIHPEAALAQARMFDKLRSQGACLGLHIHAWKYSMWRHDGQRYMAHYGGLSENEQRMLLAEAGALWQEALGEWPQYFRPGTFSANDAIFRVLNDMGFRGGSCSAPGRMMPEMQAVWTGTEPDPHRAHASFRQLPGSLDFVNMPLSADFSVSLEGRIGRRMHPDPRPDTDWETQYGVSYESIAKNIVNQVMDRAPSVPVINVVSHNHYDYCEPTDATCGRLNRSLAAIIAACESAGIKPIGATLSDVVDEALRVPINEPTFVCEGNIMEKAGAVGVLGR
ncbi:hypothetical protein ERD78_05255 [Allopusillimonas soli]|uniref:Polysaccharide deacetylase family protein n=1 Tax=Allopusillimonas soli TaxID=659016 RepID=A0A853FCJ9_9BURK|nr:polysaccharide deacetylase family protein [Allopusillimonas soli]NYT36271.1 polysaccharide deacetylase family protein [Allopusillimonas soli]TEA76595.1 hypothetical protein ERD78_05255 [Allopusillimonas soli]